jgi:hypothetical protein
MRLRVALAVSAAAVLIGHLLRIAVLTDVAVAATAITSTLVMLYLPRSSY